MVLVAGCTAPAAAPQTPATQTPATQASIDYGRWQAGRSTPVADPVYPRHGNPAIDVLHYGLELTWAPDAKTLTGRATLRLRATADVTELRLDLSDDYRLGEVLLDGVKATGATLAGDKLTVPGRLRTDAHATLIVSYAGTPAPVRAPTSRGDFDSVGLTVTADGSLWTMQEPFGAFTWYPANDQPSDKALYDMAITVPPGWSGVAGGTPAGRDGATFRYTTTDPMATYLATLAVGRYASETATGPRGLPITYWFQPGTDDALMQVVREMPRYLAWLEAKFGPYPFPSAGVVIVPSQSAMETQQMVTLGRIVGSRDYREGIVLHELAHHWFGDTVTTATWADLWLNEGWTMYAQYLFQNERDRVSDSAFERWARGQDATLRARFGPPGKADPADFARSNVYVCPALMLHEIRQKVGDDAFFALARGWVADNRNTARDRAAFIAYVNRQTGTDFTDFIDAWLDSPTTPP